MFDPGGYIIGRLRACQFFGGNAAHVALWGSSRLGTRMVPKAGAFLVDG